MKHGQSALCRAQKDGRDEAGIRPVTTTERKADHRAATAKDAGARQQQKNRNEKKENQDVCKQERKTEEMVRNEEVKSRVQKEGVEPSRVLSPPDFESGASASSATPAKGDLREREWAMRDLNSRPPACKAGALDQLS